MKLKHILPVAACAALVAGCGDADVEVKAGKTLNDAKAEKLIAQGIEKQTPAKDVEVSCPDDIALEKGEKFKCEVSASNAKDAAVDGTVLDTKGNIRWKLVTS